MFKPNSCPVTMACEIPLADDKRREVIASYAAEMEAAIALETAQVANNTHPIIVFICESISEWNGSKDLVIHVPETFWDMAEVNRATIINMLIDKGYTADVSIRVGSKSDLVLIVGKTLL